MNKKLIIEGWEYIKPYISREYGELDDTLPMYTNLGENYHLLLLAENNRYLPDEEDYGFSLLDSYTLCWNALEFIRKNKKALLSKHVSVPWFTKQLDDIFKKSKGLL